MRLIGMVLGLALVATAAVAAPPDDAARWRAEARRVTIVRDDWGIAHVHGKTDAEAVFGMAYAQAEDDFNRVEANYLTSLGRTAEAEGPSAIWQDLRQKLYIDPADLQAKYAASPPWLKALMDGWADGLNFYLATHPETKPRVIARFEPWMALSFTEGSIGGDIEDISLRDLETFYGGSKSARAEDPYAFREPTGSNGIAIGPQITKDGHALLLINPHTSFFFRSELQMTSDEGLNAYGAVTWGQLFVYQGFNAHAGWMHTSSGVDVVDEFAESQVSTPDGMAYRYGGEVRKMTVKTIVVPYRAADGSMASRTFKTYATHHGPIVRMQDGKWIAFAMMYRPVEALQQSFLRTKTSDYASFAKVAELKANSSNNTLFADDKGETAYLHPQFIPRRDDGFDYTRPVDGSDPATDWQGLHEPGEAPQVLSPANGWVYNSNDAPWTAAGPASPKKAAFPKYMDEAGENPRGPHAIRVLSGRTDFTRESLLAAAFDPFLPAFDRLIPKLKRGYDAMANDDMRKVRVAEQVAALSAWDRRWSAASTETSLAVFWGEALWAKSAPFAKAVGMNVYDYMAERSSDTDKLGALAEASDRLATDFGSWKTPWGEINRFQRLNDDIEQTFHDDAPSIAVPFTSAQWGSLASFGAKRYPGTKRYYGTNGNSFVAVVEFGPKVRALAVTAGGESGHPGNPHFDDQAERYAGGNLREVYFWPEQLKGHTERSYSPGERK
ncbi:penicillin acylase family protein [Phenylobacterium sp.]|uniref:penicillin acylase family protein n=1 Tax=Phenylobacterium sp. TaxID=1871053 RepID=UPI0025D450C3|nr:penicillin acylase family protein [Phenylobacterium sp.]